MSQIRSRTRSDLALVVRDGRRAVDGDSARRRLVDDVQVNLVGFGAAGAGVAAGSVHPPGPGCPRVGIAAGPGAAARASAAGADRTARARRRAAGAALAAGARAVARR